MPEPRPKPEFLPLPSGEETAKGIVASVQRRASTCARSNYASALGDICERRLVYRRVIGDQATPFGDGLLGIFATGDLLTPLFIERIFNPYGRAQAPAWEIQEREKAPNDPALRNANIGLQIDGVRHVADIEGRKRPYNVVEFKTMNGNMWDRIKTLDDIGLSHWTAKYPDQLMIGMYGCGMVENPGWLVLINKENLYECRVIEVPFDWSRVERLLQRAGRINTSVDAIEAMHLNLREKRIPDDVLPWQICRPDICPNCEFVQDCSPKLEGNPDDAPVIIGPEHEQRAALESLLIQYEELEPKRLGAEQAKAKLVDQIIKGQSYIVGEYVISWRPHGKYWRMDVTNTARGKEIGGA